MKWYVVAVCAVLLLPVVSADLLSMQGTVTNSTGDPANGNITLSIYAVSSGGSPVYSEFFENEVVDGTYDVVLGQSSTLDITQGQSYWLEMTVNGEQQLFDGQQRKEFTSPIGQIRDVTAASSDHSLNIRSQEGYGLRIEQNDSSTNFSQLLPGILQLQHSLPYLHFSNPQATYEWVLGVIGDGSPLFFIGQPSGQGYDYYLTIQNGTGNVGIGTSDPQQGLVVNATANFTQMIYVPTPTEDSQAASKGYVDSQGSGGLSQSEGDDRYVRYSGSNQSVDLNSSNMTNFRVPGSSDYGIVNNGTHTIIGYIAGIS